MRACGSLLSEVVVQGVLVPSFNGPLKSLVGIDRLNGGDDGWRKAGIRSDGVGISFSKGLNIILLKSGRWPGLSIKLLALTAVSSDSKLSLCSCIASRLAAIAPTTLLNTSIRTCCRSPSVKVSGCDPAPQYARRICFIRVLLPAKAGPGYRSLGFM